MDCRSHIVHEHAGNAFCKKWFMAVPVIPAPTMRIRGTGGIVTAYIVWTECGWFLSQTLELHTFSHSRYTKEKNLQKSLNFDGSFSEVTPQRLYFYDTCIPPVPTGTYVFGSHLSPQIFVIYLQNGRIRTCNLSCVWEMFGRYMLSDQYFVVANQLFLMPDTLINYHSTFIMLACCHLYSHPTSYSSYFHFSGLRDDDNETDGINTKSCRAFEILSLSSFSTIFLVCFHVLLLDGNYLMK